MTLPRVASRAALRQAGLEEADAAAVYQLLVDSPGRTPADTWLAVRDAGLNHCRAFEAHVLVRRCVFPQTDQPGPEYALWQPDARRLEQANLNQLMDRAGVSSFDDLYAWSLADRAGFWRHTAELVGMRFIRQADAICRQHRDAHGMQWFPGARLNTVASCFGADPAAPAVIAQGADGELQVTSYGELRALVNRVSKGLCCAGLVKGDAMAMVMPMNLAAVAIYLGAIQAGLVVAAIPDSCAWPQIQTRLRISRSKLLFTCDRVPRGDRMLGYYARLGEADIPMVVQVIHPDPAASLRDGDITLDEFLADHAPFESIICDVDDPIGILFSSGTTGQPKAIPWTHLTPLKCASDGFYYQDIHPGDVVAWPTNLGWMMGPWLIFATLMNRAVMALYTDAPTTRQFGQFLQQAGVRRLGVIPSIVRQWRTTGCMEDLDLSHIDLFSSTGECSSDLDMHYLMYLAGYRPIIEYCGGTEIAGGYLTSTVLHPSVPATFTTAALGMELAILDEQDQLADRGECFLMSPAVGLSQRLVGADHEQVYHGDTPMLNGRPLRRHGDFVQRFATGYYRVEGRADDAMNLGGIKVSSREIEQVIQSLDEVLDAAAVAVPDAAGGPSRLVIFAVPAEGVTKTDAQLLALARQAVREQLNPLFKVHDFKWIDSMPRTASHKVMRRQLRQKESDT